MTELERTAIDFFRAVQSAGEEDIGRGRFGFKLDVNISVPVDLRDAAIAFNAKVQEALTNASNAIQPVITAKTTLQ